MAIMKHKYRFYFSQPKQEMADDCDHYTNTYQIYSKDPKNCQEFLSSPEVINWKQHLQIQSKGTGRRAGCWDLPCLHPEGRFPFSVTPLHLVSLHFKPQALGPLSILSLSCHHLHSELEPENCNAWHLQRKSRVM